MLWPMGRFRIFVGIKFCDLSKGAQSMEFLLFFKSWGPHCLACKLFIFLLPAGCYVHHYGCQNMEAFVNDTVVLFVDNFEENPEMWDLTPDLEDIIKPLGRAEPPQTSATRTFNNQDSVPHIHCHQKLQEKPGPVHLQTCSTNQHVLGVRKNKNSGFNSTKCKGKVLVCFKKLTYGDWRDGSST